MKYIRTKDGIYESEKVSCDDKYVYKYEVRPIWCVNQDQEEIISQADTIEELCDKFVFNHMTMNYKEVNAFILPKDRNQVYGAIWTDKGLIYVAKMDDKGELELI